MKTDSWQIIVTDYFPTVHVDTPIMDMLFKFHAYWPLELYLFTV